MLLRLIFAAAAFSIALQAHATPVSTFDDFENGAPGWTIPSGDGVTTAAAYSGTHSLGIAANSTDAAVSPIVQGSSLYYSYSFYGQTTGVGSWGGYYNPIVPYTQGTGFSYQTYAMRSAPAAVLGSSTSPLYVDDVSVQPATAAQAATALRKYVSYAMPGGYSYAANVPQTAAQQTPLTLAALKSGQTVNMVMLGDSIVADQYTSAWETRLAGTYSGHFNIQASVVGSTGCSYYAHPSVFQTYVGQYLQNGLAAHEQNIVDIGGISHDTQYDANHNATGTVHNDTADIGSVIDQIRAIDPTAEILLTDEIASNNDPASNPSLAQPLDPNAGDWRAALYNLSQSEHVGFFDLTLEYAQYAKLIESEGYAFNFLKRDSIHDNANGEQVAGQEYEAFFAPEPSSLALIGVGAAMVLRRRRRAA